jgi:hypothetical protein
MFLTKTPVDKTKDINRMNCEEVYLLAVTIYLSRICAFSVHALSGYLF